MLLVLLSLCVFVVGGFVVVLFVVCVIVFLGVAVLVRVIVLVLLKLNCVCVVALPSNLFRYSKSCCFVYVSMLLVLRLLGDCVACLCVRV